MVSRDKERIWQAWWNADAGRLARLSYELGKPVRSDWNACLNKKHGWLHIMRPAGILIDPQNHEWLISTCTDLLHLNFLLNGGCQWKVMLQKTCLPSHMLFLPEFNVRFLKANFTSWKLIFMVVLWKELITFTSTKYLGCWKCIDFVSFIVLLNGLQDKSLSSIYMKLVKDMLKVLILLLLKVVQSFNFTSFKIPSNSNLMYL